MKKLLASLMAAMMTLAPLCVARAASQSVTIGTGTDGPSIENAFKLANQNFSTLDSSASAASQSITQLYTGQYSVPNVYGHTPANLQHWRAALGRVRSGTGRAKAIFVGDSKDAGYGAITAASAAGASPYSKPDQFATSFPGNVVGTNITGQLIGNRQAWAGSKSLASTALVSAYDTRLTFGASWSGGSSTLGGVGFASAGTDSLVFAPVGPVTTVDVFTKAHAGDGTLTVTADGSATVLATINGATAGEGFIKTTVALGAAGTHTISVQRTTGGYATVFGMVAYNTAVPAIDVVNAGAIGSTSAFHTSATNGVWAAQAALATWKPDLTVVQLGTNDLNQSIPTATTLANIQAIITSALAAGSDCAIENPSIALNYGTTATQVALQQGLIALGATNGCVVIDHAARFGTEPNALALGLMSTDNVHETAAGDADEAQALITALVF